MANDELRRELAGLIPRLRRFARVLTGNMSDADDVVQAALEKAMRNLGQWQEGTRLDRWVFAIARNTWIDDRRLAHNRAQFDDISTMTDLRGEDGLAIVEGRSTQRAVQEAITRLPDDQRTLIALVIIEGYSYREAAEILSIPIGTVMSRLARGKSALAELLGDGGSMP